jgi:hypothetical protein
VAENLDLEGSRLAEVESLVGIQLLCYRIRSAEKSIGRVIVDSKVAVVEVAEEPEETLHSASTAHQK